MPIKKGESFFLLVLRPSTGKKKGAVKSSNKLGGCVAPNLAEKWKQIKGFRPVPPRVGVRIGEWLQ